jgi:ankyrin repeat protein
MTVMQDKFNPVASLPPIVAEKLGRALMEALQRKNAPVDVPKVLELIRAGADINIKDRWQRTPLHCAVELDNAEVASALIAHGAKLDEKNHHKHTPLAVAAIYNRTEIARLLLEAGCMPDPENGCRERPIDLAESHGNKQLAAMIEKAIATWRDRGLPLWSDVSVSKPLTLKR